MSLENFFLSRFKDCDFIARNKARIFLYYSFFILLLLALLLVFYRIMPLDPDLARRGFLGGAGIVVLVIASLFTLRGGNLNTAVWVYALPTIIAVIGLRIINTRTAPETAFSTYIFYVPYLIIYTAVFAKRVHVVVVTVVFFLSNWLVWLIARGAPAELQSMLSTGIINSSMGILTTAVISYSLINIMAKYMVTLQNEAQTAAEKLEHIRLAMEVAHDGLHVGASLVSEAESMEAATGTIEEAVAAIRQDVGLLRTEVDRSGAAQDSIVGSTAQLTGATEQYQNLTLHASAAVEEMTAAIESISSVSSRNRDSVEQLARSISGAMEVMDTSARTIENLTESSSSLQDVVDVISAISGQTNLLAMNAAIEAAHAGDSGKGFAVVAEEIRRLAEETASNSQTISDGLSRFFQEISNAGQANKQIETAFKQISIELQATRNAFDEILSGMRELSVGTSDINTSVSDVVNASRYMNSSINDMNGMITGNADSIEAVRQKTALVLDRLDTISSSFVDILNRAVAVRELGQRSEAVIRELDESIRAI